MAAVMSTVPLDNAMPVQKEMFEGRKSGRTKIHKDRPKPQSPGRSWITNRHKLIPAILEKLRTQRTLQDRQNRYNKSHRSPELQDKYEERIIRITAMRFKVQPNEQFPLQAIIKMADLGVRQAIDQYNKLSMAAESLNISIRDAYDHFVLGKELNNLRKAHEPT